MTSERELTKDSADVAAILEDVGLVATKRFIAAARTGTPANPARALRLLRLIATRRPVAGLLEDAAGFPPQDRAYILAVAALERDVEQAARILLGGGDAKEQEEIARTFARQRLTSDVAELIKRIRPVSGQNAEDREKAAAVVKTILSEFARGADKFTHGGRQVFDIALVYVHLLGAGCADMADALLSEVFAGPWRAGLAADLAAEFAHYVPGTDVLAKWAGRGLSVSAVEVMRDLILLGGADGPGGGPAPQPPDPAGNGAGRAPDRTWERIDAVGEHWPPKPVAHLCQDLEKRGRADVAAVIRSRTLTRPNLRQVAEAVAVWWRLKERTADRDSVLDDAVRCYVGPGPVAGGPPAVRPRTVPEVRELAAYLGFEIVPDEVRDLVRKHSPVDGCSGEDLAELLYAISERARRDAGDRFAKRMALAAKEGRTSPHAVAAYIASLRGQQWKGSRQAANAMFDELVSSFARDPRVVGLVCARLLTERQAVKDAESTLRRYLTNHGATTSADVVALFGTLDAAGVGQYRTVQELPGDTVAYWPPVKRSAAVAALRAAGMTDRAAKIR